MLCGNNKAFDKTADVQTGLHCCWLTLLHTILYTIVYNFGLSECNRVKHCFCVS